MRRGGRRSSRSTARPSAERLQSAEREVADSRRRVEVRSEEEELVAARIDVDLHGSPLGVAPLQDREGDLVADLPLDETLERAGAVGGVVALGRQPALGPFGD